MPVNLISSPRAYARPKPIKVHPSPVLLNMIATVEEGRLRRIVQKLCQCSFLAAEYLEAEIRASEKAAKDYDNVSTKEKSEEGSEEDEGKDEDEEEDEEAGDADEEGKDDHDKSLTRFRAAQNTGITSEQLRKHATGQKRKRSRVDISENGGKRHTGEQKRVSRDVPSINVLQPYMEKTKHARTMGGGERTRLNKYLLPPSSVVYCVWPTLNCIGVKIIPLYQSVCVHQSASFETIQYDQV